MCEQSSGPVPPPNAVDQSTVLLSQNKHVACRCRSVEMRQGCQQSLCRALVAGRGILDHVFERAKAGTKNKSAFLGSRVLQCASVASATARSYRVRWNRSFAANSTSCLCSMRGPPFGTPGESREKGLEQPDRRDYAACLLYCFGLERASRRMAVEGRIRTRAARTWSWACYRRACRWQRR